MQRNTWTFLSLLLFPLVLAACGGGSGGDDPVANDPEILATDPAPFEVDVDEERLIHIDWAVSLDAGADYADFLDVETTDGPVAGTWSYDAAARRLTFVPDDDLSQGLTHTVQIEPGLPYDNGDTREDPFAFSFDVRMPGFSGAQPLETRPERVYDVRMDSHPQSGGMLILRHDATSGDDELVARRKRPEGGFEDSQTLRSGVVSAAQIVSDARGNAVAMWHPTATSLAMRYYDRAVDSWRPARTLASHTGRRIDIAKVTFDGNGNVIFAWREKSNIDDRYRVAGRRYRAAGSLDTPSYSSWFEGDLRNFELDVNDEGNAVLAYDVKITVGGPLRPYVKLFDPITQWGAETLIDAVATRTSLLRGAKINPDGYVMVLLASQEVGVPDDEHLRVSFYNPSDDPFPGWHGSFPLDGDRGFVDEYFLHVSASGVFVIAWVFIPDTNTEEGFLRVTRYRPGVGFFGAGELTEGLAPYLYDGYIETALSPEGDLVALWSEVDYEVRERLFIGMQRNDGTIVKGVSIGEVTGLRAFDGLMVAASGGVVYAMWDVDKSDVADDGETLYALRGRADGTLESIEPLREGAATNYSAGAFAIDADGDATIVWIEERTDTGQRDAWYAEHR